MDEINNLQVTLEDREGYTVVSLNGEVDHFTAHKLREEMDNLHKSKKYQVIVDMTCLDFLDSSGLGLLKKSQSMMRDKDGDVILVCSNETILKLFRITGLEKEFKIFPTLAECIFR